MASFYGLTFFPSVINDQVLSVSISDLLHGENLQGSLETLYAT